MKAKTKVWLNAPVILSCALLSGLILMLDSFSGGWLSRNFFMSYPSNMLNPLYWFRLVFNFLGNATLGAYLNNMTLFLLLGPVLEQRYGGRCLILLILSTSTLAGVLNALFGSGAYMLGTSSIDFAFSVLLAMSVIRRHRIPVSLLAVAVVYAAGECVMAFGGQDVTTSLAHLAGAVCGVFFGILLLDKTKASAAGKR